MSAPAEAPAAQGAAGDDLARRLLRLSHVVSRHRRADCSNSPKIAEFDRSPLTDIKHCGPCDIALIEGGVCNADNVHVAARTARQRQDPGRRRRLRDQRRPAGAAQPARHRRHPDEVYRDPTACESCVPNDPELPLLLDKVYPVNEIVRVDYFIPGCPPSGDAIWKFLTDLILGRMPRLDHELLHYD